MDKEQRTSSSVNGFVFGSASDVELAKQELNSAKYIDSKIADKNAATVLAIYKAALEKKIFRTPVGYAYMHDLQKRMVSMGIRPEDIDPIPLFQVFGSAKEEKAPRVITVKKKKEPYERKNAMLTLVNFILIIMIIIMFIISLSGSRPTVLNYKRAIENEYSAWKQELDQRESLIKEKERELNLVYGNGEDTNSR